MSIDITPVLIEVLGTVQDGWNKCPLCLELTDVPDPCFDGCEVICIHCQTLSTAVCYEDNSWALEPVTLNGTK